MGKGEIVRYEQFLLFPQGFQKACFPGASKGVIVLEWVETYYVNALFKFFCLCIHVTLYAYGFFLKHLDLCNLLCLLIDCTEMRNGHDPHLPIDVVNKG